MGEPPGERPPQIPKSDVPKPLDSVPKTPQSPLNIDQAKDTFRHEDDDQITDIRDELSILMGEKTQEKSETVKNAVEKMNKIFYARSAITANGRISLPGEERSTGVERPLFTRAKRAELLAKLKTLPKEDRADRKKIIEEAHLIDELVVQYLNQADITVNLPGLGEQGARVVELIPPEGLRTEETFTKPEIFLIPGASNDVECVGSLALEVAMVGRRVRVVGYPDSYKGKTTSDFADAVKKDEGLGPHVAFFKAAIGQFYGNDEKLELWGYSTGAPIISSMLSEPDFQKRTENAVLLFPASSVDQSLNRLNIGASRELGQAADKELPKFTLSTDSKTPRTEEQKQVRKLVNAALMEKVCTRLDYWKDARVQQGGSIVTVTGRKDRITKSARRNDEFLQHPQMRLIDIPKGYHGTPLIHPEEVVSSVFAQQKQ